MKATKWLPPFTRCALLSLGVALLTSCAGAQSALDPAGPQSHRLSKIWWLFFYVTLIVYVLVVVFLLIAAYRGKQRKEKTDTVTDTDQVNEKPDLAPNPERERRMTRTVSALVAITTLILLVLTVASFSVGRSLSSNLFNKNVVSIEVTGHQWWWEVRYNDALPSRIFTTANEIHVPVGRPVTVKLSSQDVNHSFWAPNLFGKKDLIPGHDAVMWFQADKPGVYRGQCAEFCGLQHAHMAFWIVAESPDQFEAWANQQRGEALSPTNEAQQHGQQVFLSSPCVMCHTIQGTGANANLGPNLSHVASRSYIAAGTLPNTRGHLAGWVSDSQAIKPGNRMPPNNLSPEDLQALLDYLQSLK